MASAPSNNAPLQTGGGTTKAIGPGAFQVRSMENRDRTRYLNMLVYGKHGAGKTTLMRSIIGFYSCSSGKILWNGKIVNTKSKKHKIANSNLKSSRKPASLDEPSTNKKAKSAK